MLDIIHLKEKRSALAHPGVPNTGLLGHIVLRAVAAHHGGSLLFCHCNKNTLKRQPKGGRIYLGSQLEDVVHHGTEVMRQELEEATSHIVFSAMSQRTPNAVTT